MRINKLTFTAVVFSLILAGQLKAQSGLTLYNFNAVPQSLHMNPGYDQQSRLWIALPVISGFYVGYHNSAFTPYELLESGTDVNENLDNIINNLKDNSQLDIRNEIDLLGVGFRTKVGFFTVGARLTTEYITDYPKDLMRFVRFGNAADDLRTANLSDWDFELLSRYDYYVGWQHKFLDDKLSVGVRAKYIFGMANVYAERTNISVVTQDDSKLILETDALIRTAGATDFINSGGFEINDVTKTIFPANQGVAIDLGGTYDINEQIQVSASVLDLGSINWKANNYDLVSSGKFEFDGADANLSDDEPINEKYFENLRDSLFSAFEFDTVSGQSYSRSLSPRLFLGGTYSFNEKHAVGILMQSRFFAGQMYSNYSVNYVGRVSRAFQYTVSYSIINNTFNNIGAGISARLGPVQLYLVSDNVFHMVFPSNLQSTNLRVGLNLAFYEKKIKKTKPVPEEPVNNN